jgi:hypothetical protein
MTCRTLAPSWMTALRLIVIPRAPLRITSAAIPSASFRAAAFGPPFARRCRLRTVPPRAGLRVGEPKQGASHVTEEFYQASRRSVRLACLYSSTGRECDLLWHASTGPVRRPLRPVLPSRIGDPPLADRRGFRGLAAPRPRPPVRNADPSSIPSRRDWGCREGPNGTTLAVQRPHRPRSGATSARIGRPRLPAAPDRKR